MDGATLPQPVAAGHEPGDAHHTFICYSRRDVEFVLDLASRLRDRGVPVWLDLWDIRVGEDWDRTIEAALAECASVLIVLSPDAVGSDEVRGELRSALNRRKPIVPVLYRSCDIPRQLQNTQYLDVSDSGDLTEGQLYGLAARLRGESPPDDEARRSWKTWTPGAWVVRRLKTVGASAAGAIVLVAASGLLAEASYARLFRLEPSLSPSRVLRSGLYFFVSLALPLSIAAALVLLAGFVLYRVAERWLPRARLAERAQRLLARPGLLWTAQGAACVLLCVSLSAFAALLPLSYIAYDWRLADIEGLREGDYTLAVAHVVSATLVLGVLEAWRRRLSRKRQYGAPTEARLSLGLAAPLYFVVGVELLFLPIGQGALAIPSKRDYLPVKVTFSASYSETELAGQTRVLLQLRPDPIYRFYCPDGARTWDVDAGSVTVAPRRRATLARLLAQFRSMPDCRIGSGVPEEVRE